MILPSGLNTVRRFGLGSQYTWPRVIVEHGDLAAVELRIRVRNLDMRRRGRADGLGKMIVSRRSGVLIGETEREAVVDRELQLQPAGVLAAAAEAHLVIGQLQRGGHFP